MKLSFKKFIALALSVFMLAALSATAQTNGLTVSEGNEIGEAIEFDALEKAPATSDGALNSDADEETKSDADEIITSDAEDVIASDATEENEENKTPSSSGSSGSAGSSGSTGSSSAIKPDAKPEETKKEETTEDMALNFSDLTSDDWAYNSILNLVKKGIVSGDTIGTIRPDGNVTREEVAKMMVVARRFAVSDDTAIKAADSASVSDWAKGYFKTAMDKGIITGYTDGTVRGTGSVNRAEMATIIVRSINASIDGFTSSSFTDITENDWYAKYVECAKTLGIVNGYQDGSFAGENLVTRREAFAMIERMVRLLEALEA